jgi:hypothetical protein
VFANHTPDPPQFGGSKSLAMVEPDGIKPELGKRVVALYMNMMRLAHIAGVEKEPIRSDAEDCGHDCGA